MDIEFDEDKNQKNIVERQLPFTMVQEFDFTTAKFRTDVRHKNEHRIRALGKIDNRVFLLIYTMRNGKVRVISFRKANAREVKEYETKPIFN